MFFLSPSPPLSVPSFLSSSLLSFLFLSISLLFLLTYFCTAFTNLPPPQILGSSSKPGGFSAKLHEVHRQFALPPLPLHRGLCLVGDAAVWRTVSINTDLKTSSLLCINFMFLSFFVFMMVFHIFLFFFSDSTLKTEPHLLTLTLSQQQSWQCFR